MELYANNRVTFYEEPHRYVLDNDVELIGVTSLMKKHGLSPDYGGIDEKTLKHAARLGSMAHQVIENYCNGMPVIETDLVRSFAKLGLNIIATEYLVTDNETVASKVDLVEGVDDSSVVLWDVKRTSTVHREALRWQLGIYKYLVERANPLISVVGCKCLPLKKGNRDDVNADVCGTPVDITPVTAEEVERLLECERRGEHYLTGDRAIDFATEAEMLAICEVTKELAIAKASVATAEAKLAEFYDKAYRYMLENDIDEMSDGRLRIKLKRPYSSTRMDSAKFRKEHPELADRYMKTSEVKGNITINII